MIKFANSQFCVHDQDEALMFCGGRRTGNACPRDHGGVPPPLAECR